MKSILIVLISLSLLANNGQAQESPYEFTLAKDLPISLIGSSSLGVGFFLFSNKTPLTEADLQQLDPLKIPSFDRFATDNWSTSAQNASDVLLFTSAALPLTLLLDKDIRKDALKVTAISMETFILNAALTGLSKELAKRKRPFVYNETVANSKKLTGDALTSFFSGHTSVVAVSTFTTAKIYSDYHPDSKALPYIWTAAAAIPALTAYLRVKGGKHFLSDVVVGYLVGAGIGFLVPHLHKKKK